MIDLALEITAWALTIAGMTVIAWALLWDRSRGRRRCPGCWYDMGGAKADGQGRFTCSECGRVVRRERALRKARRRWRWATAGVCALGLAASCAYGPIAMPRVRDRGWIGAVPTNGLILGHQLLDNVISPGHSTEPRRDETGLLVDLGEELSHRVTSGLVRPYQSRWVGASIAASAGPHLFLGIAPETPGPLGVRELEPIVNRQTSVREVSSTLHGRMWMHLLLTGEISPASRARAFDSLVVELHHPEAWPSDRPLPVRISIDGPFGPFDEVAFEIRDASGKLLLDSTYNAPLRSIGAWNPVGVYDDGTLVPHPSAWMHGFVFIEPEHRRDPLDITITATGVKNPAVRISRTVRLDSDVPDWPVESVQRVADASLSTKLLTSFDPRVSISGDGTAVRLQYPNTRDTRAILDLMQHQRITLGAELVLTDGRHVLARGAIHVPVGDTTHQATRRLAQHIPLTVIATPEELREAGANLRLHLVGDRSVAQRDFGTERAWDGALVWALQPSPEGRAGFPSAAVFTMTGGAIVPNRAVD